MNFSKKILEIKESPIRKLVPLALNVISNGGKVIYLNIGQPNLETPEVFFKAIKSFESKILSYSSSRGHQPLIDSIIHHYRLNNISLESENILVTSGASEAINFGLSIICNPDDEILVPEPFYANTATFIKKVEAILVPIPTYEIDGYHLPNASKIQQLISSKTKAIFITNPNNPSGTVYSLRELMMISELAIKNDLFIFSDEVYSSIVFDKLHFHSFGAIKQVYDRVILIDSVSKRFSSCGARIGALISKNKSFMNHAIKLAQARLSVSTTDQVGATELFKIQFGYHQDIKTIYESRRNFVLKELHSISDISFTKPEGAFYILITLPVQDAEHFASWLLINFRINNETLFVAPARDFYSETNNVNNQIRLAFVQDQDTLKRAINILKEGLIAYQDNN
jgi:aspartate aminotransferase